MSSSTTNLNFAACLRDVEGFGVTHVHNVCNGTITDVPWGMDTWFGILFMIAVTTAIIGGGYLLITRH